MNIEDNSLLMMSEALKDNVQLEELAKYQSSIVLCVMSILVGDAVENVVGNILSHKLKENHEKIEMRVSLIDGFGLTDAWPKINIQKYELQLADSVITKQGPYRIFSFEIKEIDFERQMCVLKAKLRKE